MAGRTWGERGRVSRTTTESAWADEGRTEAEADRPEAGSVRPTLDPFDPVALERRLVEARERRAVALANRKAGEGSGARVPVGPSAPATAAVAYPFAAPEPVVALRPDVRAERPVPVAERPVLRAEPRVELRAEAVEGASARRRIGMLLPFGLGVAFSIAAATAVLILNDGPSGDVAEVAAVAPPVAEVPPGTVGAGAPTPVVPSAEAPSSEPLAAATAEAPVAPDAAALPAAAPDVVAGTAGLAEPAGGVEGEVPRADALAEAGIPTGGAVSDLDAPAADPAPVVDAAPAAAGVLAAILPLVTTRAAAPEPTSRTRVAYFPPDAPLAAPPVIGLAQAGFEVAGLSGGAVRTGLHFGAPVAVDPLQGDGWQAADVRAQRAATRPAAKLAPVRQAELLPRVAAPVAAPVASGGSPQQRDVLNSQVEDLLKDRIRDIRRR